MPTLGRTAASEEPRGVGGISFRDMKEAEEFHRRRERERVRVPKESAPIRKLSQETQVYIYNAGPWTFQQPMGSLGTFTIAGLPEEKVFSAELFVAGPLIVDGIPSETYPGEGLATRIYHTPPEGIVEDADMPGHNLAMEIIGVGRMQSKDNDLRMQGVFVSERPEQKRPDKGATTEAWDAFKSWVADVKRAQEMLRRYCAKQCQDASISHGQGKFADVRTDKLYQCAAIIKATELEFPWLKDTAQNVNKKECWNCGTILKGFAMKCGACGELQVSKEQFEAEKARRAEMTL